MRSVKMVQYGQYLTSGDVWRLKMTVRCALITPVDDIPTSGIALGVIFEKNHENGVRNATPKCSYIHPAGALYKHFGANTEQKLAY